MHNLASGVGVLKNVLLNVKTKGVLCEAQLGAILDQILTPAQYEKNVKTKEKSGDHVEYAIKIPSKDDSGSFLWLPIDAKFPTEDYISLIDAYEKADIVEIETYTKSLKAKIERFAKDISVKYIDPPNTTDFAIMFLPFEGLFAEVLRIPGLFEKMQREHKITITGPTTISAFLNSLQMGFRTLAIEQRSAEVWKLLGAVKTDFGSFAKVLEHTQEKLRQASDSIDSAFVRTRSIEKRLRSVEALEETETEKYLPTDSQE